jgi:thiol-disulfide isomerase/thioredoxin
MHITDQPLNRPSGKVLVFFMGAGFCPFCAAERWPLIYALERFGRWEGLAVDKSAGADEKYLNLSTYNFAKSKYLSEYIEFIGRETADRNFEPLQELSSEDYDILDTYNPDQIIPFLMIDGQFVQVGAGYSPQLLEGLTHDQIKLEIEKTESATGKAIRAEIDNISALVCKATRVSVPYCNSENIKNLMSKI